MAMAREPDFVLFRREPNDAAIAGPTHARCYWQSSSSSPMGRTPLPATVINVKMCCAKCEEKAKEECEEVEGVVKVITNQSENKVIVYGAADPSALLKKMRRHLDKHAMYWPMDGNQDQIAPPLFPVDPRELQSQNRGRERNAGQPLQTGTVLPVDPRDGRPIVDSREVRQVERELKVDAEIRERGVPNHPIREISHGHEAGGPREVVFVPVDAKDGTPVDPRSVRKVEPARDGRPPPVEAREVVRPLERLEVRGDPRDPNHAGGQGPREVVFIPVDAKDGTPVDPRRVQQVDARDGGRTITPPHGRPGHGELREVRHIDPREGVPVEIREVRPIDTREVIREVRPIDTREVRPIDPRAGRPIDVSELRPIDPRINMVRPGDPREVQRMDPYVTRPGEPLDHRGMRPVDPRMVRQIDPRDLDPRDGGRAAAAAYGPSEPPRGGMRVPEGLVPVRTGRADSRDQVHFAPRISPTRGDVLGPRSPPAAEYMSRSPRQQPPDYGPRSPREAVVPEYGPRSPRDHVGAEYGPRSPRGAAMDYNGPRSPRGSGDYGVPPRLPAMRPVLDRELSFNEFGTGRDPRGLDQGQTTARVPIPYEPVDPRDAAAFDFLGGANPRSPRSAGNLGAPDQPRVQGYGDIDPRQFRPSEPRVLVDVTHELQGAAIRDREYDDPARDHYRRGLEGSPRRQHLSQYSEFRKGEADPREYQPKDSYFSDYHPSQHYQPGPLATQELDELSVTNPNYTKHISSGADRF